MGNKEYQAALTKGNYPYLPVLDDMLTNVEIASEVNLGVLDIPLEYIVGTKTKGRTEAFAKNFMPLLGEKTEFGSKWAYLYDSQIEIGIREPILVYEFMNRYYVLEGNKRVSVMKYVDAYSITGTVIRLIPKRSDDIDNQLYYEFLDFYQVSFNCDVWFSKLGSYQKLIKILGKELEEVWSNDEILYFKGVYNTFRKVLQTMNRSEIELTASDVFLLYLEIFGYELLKKQTEAEIKMDLEKIWDEILLSNTGNQIAIVEQPKESEQYLGSTLINWLVSSSNIEPSMLKLAFLHFGNKNESSWVYGHELGRLYLEQCFSGTLKTLSFEDILTEDQTKQAIQEAMEQGCNMIFTTASQMVNETVKAAVENPAVRFYNCSINMSYSSVAAYYARMFEAKFLLGAIAAAMNDGKAIGYVADYPIFGTISNINAFAYGARMIDPRVEIHLKWSSVEQGDWRKEFDEEGIRYISARDLISPNRASREYGIYYKQEDGTLENLASPILDWGKFYEKIVNLTCNGNLDIKALKGKQGVNYWWGMSADIIDVIYNPNLPPATLRLIKFLKKSIKNGSFHPFDGPLYDQDNVIRCQDGETLSPEEIIEMDWLARNIVGKIPNIDELNPKAKGLIQLQGVKTIDV